MAEETAPMGDLEFEEAYRLLQEVVDQLEKGSLPLQDSLALFERGTRLVRRCSAVLDEAELKVTSLTQDLDEELNQARRRAAGMNAASGAPEGADSAE